MTDTSPSLWDSWPLLSTLDKAKDTRLWHISFINNFPEQNSSVISPTHFCQSFSNRIAVVTSGNIASWFRSLLSPSAVAIVSFSSCYTSLSWKIIFSPSYFYVSPSSFAVMHYLMLYGKYTTLWAISQHSLHDSHNTKLLFRSYNCMWAICFISCTRGMLLWFPQSHGLFLELRAHSLCLCRQWVCTYLCLFCYLIFIPLNLCLFNFFLV